MKRFKPPTRTEIESNLARLREALGSVLVNSPAGVAYRAAIIRNERALDDVREVAEC